MNSKVSIIIPNYNADKYIEKCIKSILNQSYDNLEIIIIDDGSTDKSLQVINELYSKNNNIRIITQVNMNAAIARNKGIDAATGKYVLFLDSDDELYENSIELLVNEIKRNSSDLVVGNFELINDESRVINQEKVIKEKIVSNKPYKFVGITPNPSNKLFKLDIIKNNKIYFGNVRIGQDLNFFLKYILFCKKISAIEENIYKWRVLKTSMSNTYNFRIFDIVESFRDIKQFYINNNKFKIYKEYIEIIEFKHYYFQMEKQKNFTNKRARKIVVEFFSLKLKELNVKQCKNFEEYIGEYKRCKIKIFFKVFYLSRIYKILDSNKKY